MKMKEVVEILESNPTVWTIAFQNKNSIVFAWGHYRFTRLSDRFDCVMILNSKFDRVNIEWTSENPTVNKFYSGLIQEHLK